MSDAKITHPTIGDDDVEVVTYIEFLCIVPVADEDNLGHLELNWSHGVRIENEQDIARIISKQNQHWLYGWYGYRTLKQITATYKGAFGKIKLSSSRQEIMSGTTYRGGILVSQAWVSAYAERLYEVTRRQRYDDYISLCDRTVHSVLLDESADIFIAMRRHPKGYDGKYPIIAPFHHSKDEILDITQG